jgi:excisionase family DNA binding protein
MTERLMTARQVGDVLGFSAETILRWYRAGKLPGVKTPGGALRFHPAAIEATRLCSPGVRRSVRGGPTSCARRPRERPRARGTRRYQLHARGQP